MKTKTTVATILLTILALSIFTPMLMLASATSLRTSSAKSPAASPTKSSEASPAASSPTLLKTDIFNGAFSAQLTSLAPDQAVSVSFSICPAMDVPSTTIRFLIPSDLIKLVKGELLWTGDVKKDETLTLQLTITPVGEVDTGVVALVQASPNGEAYSSSYYLDVSSLSPKNVGNTFGSLRQASLVPTPTAPSVTTKLRPAMPTAEALPNGAEASTTPASASPQSTSGTIEIKGRFGYVNENGVWSDARYMLVKLKDNNDGSWSASQWTDANGYYDFVVYNSAGGRSPYVQIWAVGEWDWLTTDSSGNIYGWSTGICGYNVPDGYSYDYGSQWPTSSNEALQAGDACYTEAQFVFDWTGWMRGAGNKVTVVWPIGTWEYSLGDSIHLPLKSVASWDHVAVEHEYGHCIMWTLYGNKWPYTAYGGASHYIWSEFDGGFAIIEGWAEFMMCVVDNNPNNWVDWANGHGGNMETNDWYMCYDDGRTELDGNIIEGCCASILWDIWDPTSAADNDYLSRGFADIFWIFHDYTPGDMIAFWWDWETRFPDVSTSAGPLSTIYWNYAIDEDWYSPWGSITINSGALYTNSRWVTLTLDGEDWGSGVYYMRFSEDAGSTWGSWYYYAASCSFYLSTSGDGWKWVDVQYADYDWHTSGAGTIYDGIGLDTTPPTGSININSGATYTSSRWVTLTLSASDTYSGVAYMRFSEDLGSTWGSWYSYSTSFSFYLSTSGDGHKWVDVQYEDWAGNPTAAGTIYHGIYLDTTPPTGSIVINSGNPAYTTTRLVTLYLSYYDATSGVYKVRYSNDGTSWTAWENPAATRAWNLTSGDGSKTAYYELEDNVGWISLVYSDGIVFDTVAPVTTISHSAGSSTVSLSATDATSGVYASYYRIDLSSWITYAGSFALTGTGTHAIDYYSKDNAGNTETMKSLTVYYLTVNTDPSGVTTISGTGWYNKGTTAKTGTAPATVTSGSTVYTFSTWKEDGTAVSGNPINVLMDAAHTATAFYTYTTFSFSVSASPTTKTIVAGGSATYNVTAKLLGGTSQSVSWSISGLPSRASATFTPTSGLPTFSSTLKITTNATTPLGAYTLTVTGTGPTSHSVTITLRILNYTVSPTPFSPNADGTKDNTTAKATFWTSLAWTLTVKNSSGQVVRNLASGTGASLTALWDGKDGSGKTVPDGTYTVVLASPSFNTQTKMVVVDTKSPTVTGHWTPNLFNPHINQTSLLTYTLSEKCTVTIRIYDSSNKLVKTLQASTSKAAGTYTIVWNGTNSTGGVVTAGTYYGRIYATDTAGNKVNPPSGYVAIPVTVL